MLWSRQNATLSSFLIYLPSSSCDISPWVIANLTDKSRIVWHQSGGTNPQICLGTPDGLSGHDGPGWWLESQAAPPPQLRGSRAEGLGVECGVIISGGCVLVPVTWPSPKGCCLCVRLAVTSRMTARVRTPAPASSSTTPTSTCWSKTRMGSTTLGRPVSKAAHVRPQEPVQWEGGHTGNKCFSRA